METWDAVTSRRIVRTFEDRPVPEEDLTRILEAARRSPSAGNQQAWDFIVVTKRDRLQQLAKVWRGARHVAESPVTIAMVAPDGQDQRSRELIQYDLGQATMCMMITAADMGLGTAHSAVEDQDLARELLGFPDDKFCAFMLSVGYPGDRPLRPIKNPTRRDFDDVVHRETW
ncbi:MAG: nitroreductase family protein [Actinomycetota bacterium]